MNPYAYPYPGAPPARAERPIAIRIAGALLLVNAAILIGEAILLPHTGPSSSSADPLTTRVPFVPAITDVVIGGFLLAGSMGVRVWAIVRALLGGLVYVGLHAVKSEWLLAGMQALVSTSLLLLLIGNAQRVRIGVGLALFGFYCAVEAYGLFVFFTGKNPLGGAIAGLSGDSTALVSLEVTGKAAPWKLTAPNTKWRLRNPSKAREETSLADVWLTRPELDAHLIVITEDGATGIDVDALKAAVVSSQTEKGCSGFRDRAFPRRKRGSWRARASSTGRRSSTATRSSWRAITPISSWPSPRPTPLPIRIWPTRSSRCSGPSCRRAGRPADPVRSCRAPHGPCGARRASCRAPHRPCRA